MYKLIIVLIVTSVLTPIKIKAQNEEIPLWEKVPNSIENINYKEELRHNNNGEVNGVQNISEPTLKVFLANNDNTKNSAVIICPGGSYAYLSHIKEGDKIAKWLNSLGVSAFVLKYRLPSDLIMKDKTIGPLQDAQEAVRTVRRNAIKWKIDPEKIGIMGFSAGGHLASTASTHYTDDVYNHDKTSARPDFSILIYPVISMEDGIAHGGSKANLIGKNPSKDLIIKYSNEKQIDSNTPPTFIVHATNDGSVIVENSINYYLALKENNVPVEMHLYKDGGHGFGLGTKGSHTQWPEACKNWLIANNLLPQK